MRDVRAVDDPFVRLAIAVTEAPWTVTPQAIDPALAEHAVLQAAIFGHLNRVADAVDVPADYPDDYNAPRMDRAAPPYAAAPEAAARPAPALSRPEVAAALAAWRAYALERDAPLTRRERAVIEGVVARALGALVPAPRPESAREHVLADLADLVTRAPWRLDPAAYEPLRAAGLADDAAVFDAVATASAAGVFARVAVAIAGLRGHS